MGIQSLEGQAVLSPADLPVAVQRKDHLPSHPCCSPCRVPFPYTLSHAGLPMTVRECNDVPPCHPLPCSVPFPYTLSASDFKAPGWIGT